MNSACSKSSDVWWYFKVAAEISRGSQFCQGLLQTYLEVAILPSCSKSNKLCQKCKIKKKKLPKGSTRDISITQKIAEIICVDLQSISVVEDYPTWKNYIIHQMVSQNTLTTKIIPEMVENVALLHLQTLSVAIYIWTSKSGNYFISVTVNFVDSDWQHKHLVLIICPFSGESHTAVNIEQNLGETFSKWDIGISAWIKVWE
ncbi:hypothetical protein PR048_021464 [Dryococelus australis]|uniref:Uncharacterized protein n=1 Tax=Dryococelus australis TaxID=614101 RepID=A0ABQ9GYD4_9NEOP|nr:hypothetical protein PR048_021464 [Dryococelus australis]